jgi:hypothetical protein
VPCFYEKEGHTKEGLQLLHQGMVDTLVSNGHSNGAAVPKVRSFIDFAGPHLRSELERIAAESLTIPINGWVPASK